MRLYSSAASPLYMLVVVLRTDNTITMSQKSSVAVAVP